MVKHYVSTHSCLLGVTKNKRVIAQVVVKKFGDVIASIRVIKPRHLKALVRKETCVFVTDWVCKNAKRLVLKKVEQQFIEDFKVLNSYALELKASNPGSNVVIVFERLSPDALPTFQKMYIYLTAAREGFLVGCRRIIGLDGCFLKGLMKGQLLVAVGRDGNNQMFPIAWEIVEKETIESWSWFLKLLQLDLCIEDGLGWSLGLIHAVKELLPLIEHRMCARHIYARWGKQHQGKEFQIQFWNITRATTVPEFPKQLQQMRNLNGREKAVEELLEKWPANGWCGAFFNDVVKCDVIDNNMRETFNGVMVEARSKLVITMLEEIRRYVMQRIVVKKSYTMKWKVNFGPNIVRKFEKERTKSSKWQVDWNGAAEHEVIWDDMLLLERESYFVRLENKSCSCGKWDKSGYSQWRSYCWKEMMHDTSYITASELMARRDARLAAQAKLSKESAHQTSTTIDRNLDLPTQQSITTEHNN
ncbi:uncharacterized protein LOC120263096 [Dioscorea cayenensis subsp. rotundata]|uniref:Uncharacterized protein LOC120263096 n=1 Tax=Dioscorea cayennensis subsp. rotundata TaxID=55577 RepID=A0AB40BIK8_DIOCR|nr:uncharacterized protein LOC120263096 [Dioscorea cayenensis subsp. rotundata]